MIKQINIELKPEQINDNNLIKKIAARSCRVNEQDIRAVDYKKRSIDSRHKKPRYVLILDVYINEEIPKKETLKSRYRYIEEKAKKVIIIGAGPAGYFSALELLEHGIKPVIFERGKEVQARRRDLREIMQNGVVNPDSNYCFGEGGAGTYSDGKLYTRSNKRGDVKKVLQILIEHGAEEDILIDAHPHIGSNKLHKIVSEIRNTLLEHGAEIHFNSLVTDIILKNNTASGVIVNNTDEYTSDAVILATGHSARDIYYMFDRKQIYIESKPFAVGFRIEHPQQLINDIQYGPGHSSELPPSSYSLTAQTNGRGVFSFCMCPGGLIVPSATNSNELVVNGMSMSGRNSVYANSGIVTSVNEKDYEKYSDFGALSGLKYQEELEKRFFTNHPENPLKAPAQRMIDFVNGKKSSTLNNTSYIPGLIPSEMSKLFPKDILISLQNGLKIFGQKMKGYFTNEANVIGLESRTSSPVKIPRNKDSYDHLTIKNLYPCGEGAGYAGGIVSSAIDGQNVSKAIARQLDS